MSTIVIEGPTGANCAVCAVPARQICSACRLVNYCGAEHQRQHWKKHKIECRRPFAVETDAVVGRYLIASRLIKAGSSVFSEAPLIVGPKWYKTNREEQVPVMPCVGCYTPCRMGIHECPRCKWPACSPGCAGLCTPQLHGECSVLQLGPGPVSSHVLALTDYYRSDALMVLKCLMLQRLNGKKWDDLMDMQSHEEERFGTELYKDAEKRIVSYLRRNFLVRLKGVEKSSKDRYLDHYDAALIHRVCGIIETNYMCISLPTGLELSGVFHTACMMEHSCQPNCFFQFDHRNSFRIAVVAGRDIARGEHLKIMYTNMLWGTQLRQEHLMLTKHFVCACNRCTDATECGTYFSALRCLGDEGCTCDGLQLPKEPANPKTDWVCNKCPMVISGEEVRYLLSQMGTEVDDLLERKASICQLETTIEKLSRFLHPTHFHMFNLKHSLLQAYGHENGYAMMQLTDSQLERKMKLARELYSVCQKLDPNTLRLSLYVAVILYEMHMVFIERGKRQGDAIPGGSNQNKEPKDAGTNERLARDHLLLALDVLTKGTDDVAGQKMFECVQKALNNLSGSDSDEDFCN